MVQVSFIICTYNPNLSYLTEAVNALLEQSLDQEKYEIILIDNNSNFSLIDYAKNLPIKYYCEKRQGLTYARIAGSNKALGKYLIFVDDDNILNKDYALNAIKFFEAFPQVGAIGGKSLPRYLSPPPEYIELFWNILALRDKGNKIVIESFSSDIPHEKQKYPQYAPIGAGLVILKKAFDVYALSLRNDDPISDRKGSSLSSGGDNDIIINLLKQGLYTAYVPNLSLFHIMPSTRLEKAYLAKLAHDSYISWVQVLNKHKIISFSPISKLSYPLRYLKSILVYKPWKSNIHYINWRGAIGCYKGRVLINKTK